MVVDVKIHTVNISNNGYSHGLILVKCHLGCLIHFISRPWLLKISLVMQGLF